MNGVYYKMTRPFSYPRLALLIGMFMLSVGSSQQEMGSPRTGFQSAVNEQVMFTVTVTDGKGGYAWGLGQSAFAVYDNKVLREVAFFSGKDEPSSVYILLDTSGSMTPEQDSDRRVIDAVKGGLARFLKLGHISNEYSLVSFNEDYQHLEGWTKDRSAILRRLDDIKPKNNTALIDALLVAISEVKSGTHPKKVIILISDGEENESRHKLGELHRLLKGSDVLVYAISPFRKFAIKNLWELGERQEQRRLLEELASTSGGRVFYPENTAELNGAFELIALELRRQYRIGLVPYNDGEWHGIKVKIIPPSNAPPEMKRLVARTRKGYIAS